MIPRYHVVAEASHELQNPISREKLVQLKRDEKSGGYIITAFADDAV